MEWVPNNSSIQFGGGRVTLGGGPIKGLCMLARYAFIELSLGMCCVFGKTSIATR